MTEHPRIARTMTAIQKPIPADAVRPGGDVKGPPNERFAGPIDWSCAHCGTLLVRGVSEQYAQFALPCYQCGKWNRTPYPDEKRKSAVPAP